MDGGMGGWLGGKAILRTVDLIQKNGVHLTLLTAAVCAFGY